MVKLMAILSVGFSLLSIVSLLFGAFLFDSNLITVKNDVFIFPFVFAAIALVATVIAARLENHHVRN